MKTIIRKKIVATMCAAAMATAVIGSSASAANVDEFEGFEIVKRVPIEIIDVKEIEGYQVADILDGYKEFDDLEGSENPAICVELPVEEERLDDDNDEVADDDSEGCCSRILVVRNGDEEESDEEESHEEEKTNDMNEVEQSTEDDRLCDTYEII